MPKQRFRDQFTNIPNLLTYGRIGAIPAIVFFVLRDSPTNCMWAALLYAIASITDFLDGFFARFFGQVSMLGKFLDPLADKLAAVSILIVLLPMGRVPVWVVLVIIIREFAITGLRAIAAGEGLIISASDSAKWKTTLQLTGNTALLMHYRYSLDLYWGRVDMDFHALGMGFIYVSLVLSIYSALRYFKAFYDAVQDAA